MTRRSHRFLSPALWATLALGGIAAETAPDFNRDIRPLLSDRCFACHGFDAKAREAELRLDTPDGAFAPRDGGPAIVPGKLDESLVWQRITSTDPDEVMPPADSHLKLSPAEKDLLKRWIESGAVYQPHWSLLRVEKPAVPPGEAHPIDALVARRLAKDGLKLAAEAPQATLIRRLSLDLRGLPPSPEESAAFLADPAPDAYEKLVDRFLADPAFGERMAWPWLDAARYADSNGYQGDADRTMWPWRDWVVSAFNRNLSYDQFTVWQLAGDLLPDATPEQILATGFLRNHPINGEGGRIPEENRVDYAMDMSETTGTVWMALTLNCCRCHDHKFDPLTQRDYYSLLAFFNQTPGDGSGGDPHAAPALAVPTDEQRARETELVRQLADTDTQLQTRAEALAPLQAAWEAAELARQPADPWQTLAVESVTGAETDPLPLLQIPAATRTPQQRDQLRDAHRRTDPEFTRLTTVRSGIDGPLKTLRQSLPKVMVMADRKELRKTHVLSIGAYDKPLAEVSAATPPILPPLPAHDGTPDRLDLARWLVSRDHPLTARVTVNRFWQEFFGIGLIKTPEDFGVQSEVPVHPELLDWLAADFMDRGWDVKQLLRGIVTSRVYRQSSRVTAELLEKDPANRLLARGPRFRLPSFIIRDQALAASGLLVARQGGPPVKPYSPENLWPDATFGKVRYVRDTGESLHRRSLYTFWRRISMPPMFFDSAKREVCTVNPARTNTPLHALATLNDTTFVEAARLLAARSVKDAGQDPAAALARAFAIVLARPPDDAEKTILLDSHRAARESFAADPATAKAFLANGDAPADPALDPIDHAALAAVCLSLLNTDEALTKE